MKKNLLSVARILGIALVVLIPFLVTSDYSLHVLNLAGIYAICVLGLVFLLGFTGQLSLGHAAFMGVGAYTSSLLAVELGLPFIVTFPAAILVSMLFGLIVGIPTLKLKGHYLAMATKGLNISLVLVLTNWREFTHGADGIVNIPRPAIGALEINSERSWYFLIVAILLLCYLVSRNIERSHIGRSFKAIKEGELAAEAMGINTYKTKILALVIASALAGASGSLFAHLNRFTCPNDYNPIQSTILLSMTIIGGSEYLVGGIFGAYILTMLPEVLRFLQNYARLIQGVLIVVITIFTPTGLVGIIHGLATKIRGKQKIKISIPTT